MNTVKMKMINKTEQKKKNTNELTFWLFNLTNAMCALYIVIVACRNMFEQNPTAAFNIGVFALLQAMFSLMLNVLLHKATKDKEVYLDD